MGRCLVVPALLLLGASVGACKAELGGDDVNHETADAQEQSDAPEVQQDAAIDGTPALGPWGTPTKITGASDGTLVEEDATLSSNKLEIYFKRNDADGTNLYVMTRASETAAWSTPALAGLLNLTTANEESPRLSSDDLTIYFGRGGDIYKSTRPNTTSAWTTPTAVATLNTVDAEKWAAVCDTGYTIVSRATAANGQDLFAGTISTMATTALTDLNSTVADQGTFLSADCLHLYFQSNRDGTFDIFHASRATATDAWGPVAKLTDFNTTTSGEEDPWISTDQKTFVFTSNVGGTKDVYISTR